MAEKNADREDFWGANHFRVDNGRKWSVQPRLRLFNSDGKASLKRQKSQETTTNTQDVSKFYWFYV